MISSGPVAPGQGRVQVGGQAVLDPFDDVAGEPLVQRQVRRRDVGDRCPVAEGGGKGGDGVVTPPEDQVFGQAELLLRDAGVALQLFGVDDGVGEAGLDAVVEEDRIEDLAPRRGEAEGDVGDAEDGAAPGEGLGYEPDPFDGLHRRADVVFVAAPHREDQRVEDQVLGPQPVLVDEEVVGAPGHGQFPVAGHRHAVLLVLVDAPHHHGPAVAPEQVGGLGEPLLAILQVDGVEDALPLEPPEGQLHHRGVGAVDHERGADLAGEEIQEPGHVGGLVPVRVGHADVDDLGAPLYLGPGDLAPLLELFGDDEVLELPGADDVGPLPHQHRAGVILDEERLDPGDDPAAQLSPGRRGGFPATIRAMAAIWAGVVPQQPPTMLSHPSSTKRASFFARESGVSA